jgi:gas vesicle protein
MGVLSRAFKFALGAAAGAGVGATAALLLAPESGQDLQRKLRERIRAARLAGEEAKAKKEAELIRKFRGEVSDPGALREVEAELAEDLTRVQLEKGASAPNAIASTAGDRPDKS